MNSMMINTKKNKKAEKSKTSAVVAAVPASLWTTKCY